MLSNLYKAIALFVICLSAPAYSLEHFSVSEQEMKNFSYSCVRPMDAYQTTKEIYSMLLQKREAHKKKTKNVMATVLSFFSQTKTNQINFDGLLLSDFPAYDLEVLNLLTIHSDARYDFLRSSYPVEKRIQGDTTYIQRKCESLVCQKRNARDIFSLRDFSDSSVCKDILCASKKIFGASKGPKVLFAFLKYGIVLSSFTDINGDPQGFDESTLDAILAALAATPEHLREATMSDAIFFRFLRGQTLAIYGKNSGTIANAFGAVFDPIDNYDSAEKVYIFTHELGHRASRYKSQKLDESEDWKALSKSDQAVSLYAQKSATEDFAETYAMYRMSPQQLLQLSPRKYRFMRDKVFEGKEFIANKCTGN
jgi:hypothetical protein